MSAPTVRLILIHRGIARKFVTIRVGKDNSFFVHLYRPDGQPWCIPGVETTPSPYGLQALDFVNHVQTAFDLHKMSLHASGYIHVTNRRSERYRDGIRGPSFSEMHLPYTIVALVSCDPERLPPHMPGAGFPVRVNLVEPVAPFYARLSIVSQESEKASHPNACTFFFEEHRYGLNLELFTIENSDNDKPLDWPPFPFFAMTTAA